MHMAWRQPRFFSGLTAKLDPHYPESCQFDVSKARLSGRVLGAAVVVWCKCCDVGVVAYWCGVVAVVYVLSVGVLVYASGVVAVVYLVQCM